METISLLVAANRNLLEQAAALVTRLSDAEYQCSPTGGHPHRAGAHLRHVLEFYTCFLEGLPPRLINYDARRRDPRLETCRAAALETIHSSAAALSRITMDEPLLVLMEDAPAPDALLDSSAARELQSLASHTTHHFALIAMTLRLHGVETSPCFGMAASTLRAQKSASLAEAVLTEAAVA